MGQKLNFASRYKVDIEYDNANYFDETLQAEVNKLIAKLAEWCNHDGKYNIYFNDDVPLATSIEVSRGLWRRMQHRLGCASKLDTLIGSMNETHYTPPELHDIFEYIYEHSDQDNEYINLEWF